MSKQQTKPRCLIIDWAESDEYNFKKIVKRRKDLGLGMTMLIKDNKQVLEYSNSYESGKLHKGVAEFVEDLKRRGVAITIVEHNSAQKYLIPNDRRPKPGCVRGR